MKLRELERAATALYEAGTSVHLVGPPGVGKSDIMPRVQQILSAKYGEEFGLVCELATIRDPTDIGGFCMPAKGADGSKPIAFYTRSPLMPTAEYLAKHPRGFFFVDERNQSDPLMQKALAPVTLWKQFGTDKLPEGWRVWSASNRVSDGAGVVKALTHLVNRERIINIEPDVGSWAVWAEEQGIHPMYIAFAKQRPGVVFTDEVPKHGKSFCTPRSFVSASRLHSQLAGLDGAGNISMDLPSDAITSELIAGDVGEAAAAEMFAFFKLNEHLPTIEEIKADPMKAKCPGPERLDAAFAAAQIIVHFADAKNIDKLWKYVERLPKELQTSTAQALIPKSGSILLNSPALTKWMSENRALINASGR